MSNEDILASIVMGFVVGLFAFAVGMVRVRYWGPRLRQSRRGLPPDVGGKQVPPTFEPPVTGGMLRGALEQFFYLDRAGDLVALLFIIAMLLYGAWVAPKVRLVLAVAVPTVIMSSFVWARLKRWLGQG